MKLKQWEGDDPTCSTVRSPVSKLGVSVADQPEIAEWFASRASQNGSEGSAVLPLRLRADRVGHIDLDGRESNEEIFGTVAESWRSGFDAIHFLNYSIYGLLGPYKPHKLRFKNLSKPYIQNAP